MKKAARHLSFIEHSEIGNLPGRQAGRKSVALY